MNEVNSAELMRGMEPVTDPKFFKVGHNYRVIKASNEGEPNTVYEGKVISQGGPEISMEISGPGKGIIGFGVNNKVSAPGYPTFVPVKAKELLTGDQLLLKNYNYDDMDVAYPPSPEDAAKMRAGRHRRKTRKSRRKHRKLRKTRR
jgi:hypothetical protein